MEDMYVEVKVIRVFFILFFNINHLKMNFYNKWIICGKINYVSRQNKFIQNKKQAILFSYQDVENKLTPILNTVTVIFM